MNATRLERTLALPADVDASNVGAEHEDGVLRITIKKAESSDRSTITIK
jgi:HSP20 family molecular chaperone IbpA